MTAFFVVFVFWVFLGGGLFLFFYLFVCCVVVAVFCNRTTEVVTFRLHGWSMLGVFLLPAISHLGHKRQGLLSAYDGMHVCTD